MARLSQPSSDRYINSHTHTLPLARQDIVSKGGSSLFHGYQLPPVPTSNQNQPGQNLTLGDLFISYNVFLYTLMVSMAVKVTKIGNDSQLVESLNLRHDKNDGKCHFVSLFRITILLIQLLFI